MLDDKIICHFHALHLLIKLKIINFDTSFFKSTRLLYFGNKNVDNKKEHDVLNQPKQLTLAKLYYNADEEK